MQREKKEWQEPALEILEVNQTMAGTGYNISTGLRFTMRISTELVRKLYHMPSYLEVRKGGEYDANGKKGMAASALKCWKSIKQWPVLATDKLTGSRFTMRICTIQLPKLLSFMKCHHT